VNHGFRVLNLINSIMQMQEMLNKMGRYYISHEEILNVYIQLLEDMGIFNIYLKTSVKEIMDRSNLAKTASSLQLINSIKSIKSIKINDISLGDQTKNAKDKEATSSTNV
jgi:hypothetical protein